MNVEGKIFNTPEYLKKIEQTDYSKHGVSFETIELSMESLHQKIGENFVLKNSDSIDIENNEHAIHIEYTSIKDEDFLYNYFTDVVVDKKYISRLDIESWRELTNFDFSSKDNNETIEMANLLPEGYRMIFLQSDELVNGFADRENKIIAYLGPIDSQIAIPTLLHEIGHAWDFERMEKFEKKQLVSKHTDEFEAEKLRKERSASAFAFKKIRRFFGKESINKKDVINDLKLYALKSYCINIENTLNMKNWKGGYDTSGKDMLEEIADGEKMAKWDDHFDVQDGIGEDIKMEEWDLFYDVWLQGEEVASIMEKMSNVEYEEYHVYLYKIFKAKFQDVDFESWRKSEQGKVEINNMKDEAETQTLKNELMDIFTDFSYSKEFDDWINLQENSNLDEDDPYDMFKQWVRWSHKNNNIDEKFLRIITNII